MLKSSILQVKSQLVRSIGNSQDSIGRFAQLSDVASAVVFLASDAASMITGTSLLVDGGWTAR